MEKEIGCKLWEKFFQTSGADFKREDVKNLTVFTSFPTENGGKDFVMVGELYDGQFGGIRVSYYDNAATSAKSWVGDSEDQIIRLCLNGSERVCLGLATADV